MKVGTHTITCTATGGNGKNANESKSFEVLPDVSLTISDGTLTCNLTNLSGLPKCEKGSGVVQSWLEVYSKSAGDWTATSGGSYEANYIHYAMCQSGAQYASNSYSLRCAGKLSDGSIIYSNGLYKSCSNYSYMCGS